MVFAYDHYYHHPCGGMDDFRDDFDTWEGAKKFIKDSKKDIGFDAYEIYDLKYRKKSIIK
jgi:hypothetical protein